jgi:hypothetical protein
MQVHQAAQRDADGRAFIDQLRRSKFMIGMALAPDAEEAAAGLRQDLSSALRLLSEDLYSTKTHFILELIQNADDNDYTDGTDPQIRIALSESALKVWNNENGFSQENVRALCSVGRSTKSKKAGFIGEKGIGFKSVFQVSNRPEIHSNGFHFRFDMSDPEEHLGYIVPNWIEPDATMTTRGTTIVLPAKDQESFSAAVLSELDARLLLFLRKLRHIELRTPDEEVSMRCVGEDGLIALETRRRVADAEPTSSRQRFLRKSANVSMVDSPDDKRPKASESEVILAFPVDDAGQALAAPDCATFAFLPIRAFGFRFCVQADFLLSSSREDIQTARPWNVALRDAIAPAFVASLELFRTKPALARSFLRFLPHEQELTHSFFAPVVQKTLEALAQTECILCTTGQWRKPADVMTASMAFQRLVPAEQAWALYGKDYPAKDLEADQETLKKLGCVPLNFADIVKLFTEHGDWVRKQGTVWLANAYRYLASLNRQHLLGSGIRDAPCIPVNDGSLQAPSDRTVFFPLARGTKFGFEQDLRILEDGFAEAIGSKDGAEDEADIRGLLHDLGVRTPEPYSLIIEDILPAHRGDRWREVGFTALTGHVRYVKARLDDYLATAARLGVAEASAMETLRKGLRLKTKKNDGASWWFQHADEVYPGREYLPDFDIESLLAQDLDPLRVISPDYLPEDLAKREPQDRAAVLGDWRAFFFRLGVNPSPRLAAGANAACSPELNALLTSENGGIRRQTLECLDRHWLRYSSHATYALTGRPGTRYYTTFATTLRATIAPTRQRRQVALQDAYYATSVVRDVFGNSPTYVDAELHSEEFLDTCGIVHRVDASACIKRLKQIKAAEKPSTAQVRPLYRHLDQVFERDAASVREAFKDHALILTRDTESPWRRPDEVVWSSPGEFLSLHYPALAGQYADLHGFFVRKLKVPPEVSVAAAVRALPLLETSDLTLDARAAEALRIYVRASRDLASAPDSPAPNWLEDVRTHAVFLNHRGAMVTRDDALYADDQPATSALFLDHEDISFLAVPQARLPQIQVLLEAAEVPLLSGSLDIALEDPGVGRQNVTFTARVRERYRHIARLVYGQSHTVFERAKDAGLWRRLSLLGVQDVDQLKIRTTLQGISATTQGEVVIAGDTAFVRIGAKGVADRLAREICLMLKAPMTLVDGVSRILRDEHIAEVEEYLDVKEVAPLPDDELSQLTLEQVPVTTGMEGAGETAPALDLEASAEAPAPPQGEPAAATPVGVAKPVSGPATITGAAGGPPAPPVPQTSNGAAAPARQSPPGGAAVEGGDTAEQPPFANVPRGIHPAGGSSPRRPALALEDAKGAGWRGGKRRPAARRGALRPKDRRETGHRLLSYAEPAHGDGTAAGAVSDETGEAADRARERDATAQAAVQHVMQTQRDKWASLEEMPPYNKGFDVRAVAHDGSEHFIEIKGQSAAWTAAGIALTPAELLCAADKRERFWLCVVEHAIHPGRQVLHMVNNPFGRTDQFRFDSGWKAIATSEVGAPPLVPAPGLRIDIQNLGIGTIASVKKTGSMFYKVHVYLDDGRQVFKVFEPARMRLSQGE